MKTDYINAVLIVCYSGHWLPGLCRLPGYTSSVILQVNIPSMLMLFQVFRRRPTIDATLCQYILSAAVAIDFLVYTFYSVLIL